MKRTKIIIAGLAFALLGQLFADISLPQPDKQSKMSLMTALSNRKTSRDFSKNSALSREKLSTLLWAANGINRKDGRRTAPTGRNVQDIKIYVMLKDGIYIYDAEDNELDEVKRGDFTKYAGKQDFASDAAATLFFVHDASKAMKTNSEADAMRYAGIHTGAIMQNVYLFAAQENLSCVARAMIDYDALKDVLSLDGDERVILAQSVGYPAAERSLTRDEAIEKALRHAGVDTSKKPKVKCELDMEDGIKIYEIEFDYGKFEYDYDIAVDTGFILKSEKSTR